MSPGPGGLSARPSVVRAFISYAHVDRAFAGQAQRVLAAVGIEAFLAHEDLEVSEEWRGRLLQELARCHLFVQLLSQHYLASTWAQHEAGYIVSRLSDGVVVAPLSIDGTRAGGFLGHIQSPSVGGNGITQVLLVEPLVPRYPRTILPRLIDAASRAGSFRHAETLIAPLVRFFSVFSPDEAQTFADASVRNGQIWSAALCAGEYLPKFIRAQGSNLKPETLRALEYQMVKQEWYRPEMV